MPETLLGTGKIKVKYRNLFFCKRSQPREEDRLVPIFIMDKDTHPIWKKIALQEPRGSRKQS